MGSHRKRCAALAAVLALAACGKQAVEANVCAAGGTGPDCAPAAVLADDFETGTGAIWPRLARSARLSLAPGEGVDGGRAVRAAYVGSDVGSDRIVVGVPLPAAGDEYTLNYDVRFDRGFQFVKGGKLHGLGPAKPVTGGDPIRPDGWSARVMWRRGGEIETYTYHQDQPGKYGERARVDRTFLFEPGRWHAVSLHVRVNSPASASNGLVRLHVDGVLVETRDAARLRAADGDATRITQLLFSTFHGGNDPTWAPRGADGGYATVYAYFDNLAVFPGERVRRRPGE